MNRSARFAIKCSAILSILILAAICVRGETPPSGSNSRPTTQPMTAVYPAVTDEQIGLAITRGVDFLLSNIERSQLKPLEGEGGAIDRAGLNALCVNALLEAERATRDPRLKLSEPMMKALFVRLKQEELKEKDGEVAPLVFAHSLRPRRWR